MRIQFFLFASLFTVSCKFRSASDSSGSATNTRAPVASVSNPCPTRFQGKLPKALLQSYGKEAALRLADTPWVDWQSLSGTDGKSSPNRLLQTFKQRVADYDGLFSGLVKGAASNIAEKDAAVRGEIGMLIALLSLEQQRVDLLKCNMWDTNGAADTYKAGDSQNRDQKWATLQSANANCSGDRKRFRTMEGMCNDLDNPLMGAKGQRFGRNVSFAATAPRAGISVSEPDPKLISDKLLTRRGPSSQYRPAPFFNLISAAWIQWMTHDWFSHSRKGHNDESRKITAGKVTIPATIADSPNQPPVSADPNKKPGAGPYRNNVTFWWDASQIYGTDSLTGERVRDKKNRALLLMDANGMLPTVRQLKGNPTPELLKTEELNAHEWEQEVSGFPDNWWIGLSLLHTAFAREHNRFVRNLAIHHYKSSLEKLTPAQQEEAYQYGRLYISALIAKIHTIEWTPQLLFNPVADAAMNTNWAGIAAHKFGDDTPGVDKFRSMAQNALKVVKDENKTPLPFESNTLFAYTVAAPGITGTTTNHFGTPFTLPEEFTTVYRLHPLMPDQLEYRNLQAIVGGTAKSSDVQRIDTKETIHQKSPQRLTKDTIGNWWATFGIQPTGTLTLHNYPRFMQKLEIPQNPAWATATGVPREMDMAALEIMRDRERGLPRFNEFRRQIGLKPLTDLSDFVNQALAFEVFNACGVKDYSKGKLKKDIVNALQCPSSMSDELQELRYQVEQRDLLAEVYGTDADAIERVDTLVGIFSENTRPHGFAISETQFHIFVLNASRRLFSDRFLSSDFNPETYTQFGFDSLKSRGMREVLADNFPELKPIMSKVKNAFDPWTRPRRGFSLASGFDPINFHGNN